MKRLLLFVCLPLCASTPPNTSAVEVMVADVIVNAQNALLDKNSFAAALEKSSIGQKLEAKEKEMIEKELRDLVSGYEKKIEDMLVCHKQVVAKKDAEIADLHKQLIVSVYRTQPAKKSCFGCY